MRLSVIALYSSFHFSFLWMRKTMAPAWPVLHGLHGIEATTRATVQGPWIIKKTKKRGRQNTASRGRRKSTHGFVIPQKSDGNFTAPLDEQSSLSLLHAGVEKSGLGLHPWIFDEKRLRRQAGRQHKKGPLHYWGGPFWIWVQAYCLS